MNFAKVTARDALEMLTDSEELLVAGIGVATLAWAQFVEATAWTVDTPDRIITRKLGRRIRANFLKRWAST